MPGIQKHSPAQQIQKMLASMADDSSQPVKDLERPTLDNRLYRNIVLSNLLEVLLIHDPETEKASAAVNVNVGYFSDFKDMPGIAHAVEHLLFMGTEKYPEKNNYHKYLTSHSGDWNAYTGSTSTNYYFELSTSQSNKSGTSTPRPTSEQLLVDKDQSPLWGALDRFGQFFISPLFLENTVNLEIKAVHSEFQGYLESDNHRLHQLDNSLSNPEHPCNRFSVGSWETLHDDPIARGVKIRDKFMEFHAQHYSANQMKLVVLGLEPLDTLEEWAMEVFSKVPNKDLPRKRWDDVPVYTEKELLIQTFAQTVCDSRELELSFLYRDEEEYYEYHPSRYPAHLIGHEGPGSILAYIRAKGWATGLSASGTSLCPGSGVFQISVELTEDGLAHYREIIKIIFQYIAMIREHGPQKWVVDELIMTSEVDFRFKQKSPPGRTTIALASDMQKPYDRKMILSGPTVIRKFNAELISQSLSYLRPDNFRIRIDSQDVEWDKEEKWYGTKYRTEKIPGAFLQEIKDAFESKSRPEELHLPHKNKFIPTKFEVEKKEVSQPLKVPKLIRNDPSVRIWWKKDDQFWVPKANVQIHLRTPLPYASARATVICTLYRDLVDDALAEYAYDADISGLVHNITIGRPGIILSVQGYNDKLHVLLEKVLVQLRDLEVREDRFKVVHDCLASAYRNWHYKQPSHQVGHFASYLRTDIYTMVEEAEELKGITSQDVCQFFPQVLAQFHIEVLAHGNLYKEDALKLTDLVEQTLRPKKLPLSQCPIHRDFILPAGSNFIYERPLEASANVNHCIDYTLYLGNRQDDMLRAKISLLTQMTDEPVYSQLRTTEQLGYVVFSEPTPDVIYAGYRILIQSEKDCRYLEGRIEHFLTLFEKTLAEMSKEEFEKHKGAVISRKLEKPKNLNEESTMFHTPMVSDLYEFTMHETDASNVSKITKQEMQDFYTHFILPASTHRAKLSVHLIARAKPKETTLDDLKAQSLTALDTILKAENIATPVAPKQVQDQDQSPSSTLNSLLSAATSPAEIPQIISTYLSTTLDLPAPTVAKLVDDAKAALGLADAGLAAQVKTLPATTTVDGVSHVVEQAGARQPIAITDVHTWKAGLQVSRGAAPGRNLNRYMEDATKL